MIHLINELKIVGVESTLNLSTVGTCSSGTPTWTFEELDITPNVTAYLVGSTLTYTPIGAGEFMIRVCLMCSGEEVGTCYDITGVATLLNPTVGELSSVFTFNPCCSDCFNPIIVSDLYEGDTYIPFSLDMEDGVIVGTLSGDTGTVLNGLGVIELSTPLVAGVNIQLRVDSETCKSVSSIVKVKAISEDCDTYANPNTCHIRVLNVSIKYDGVNLVSISNLNVEAFGELRYRLDNGEWFSDWASIGSFSSLINHTLGIKLVNNPSCRIEYPFLAITYA